MRYKIKEVSELAGVSERTLRYYDKIGLLSPDRDSESGYRIYRKKDLERLQGIMFYKELGFALEEIQTLVDKGLDEKTLEKHRTVLMARKSRLEGLIDLIDRMERGEEIAVKKRFEPFSMEEVKQHQEKYRKEVDESYDPAVVEESRQRTGKYSSEDWKRITEEGNAIFDALAALMDKEPSDPDVQTLVERYRGHIDRYFYTCTLEIFKGLGQLYLADQRFMENLDKHGEGFAAFLSQAIDAYRESES